MRKLKSYIIVLWSILKVKYRAVFHPKKDAKINQEMQEVPKYKNPALNIARTEFERRGELVKQELTKYIIPDEKMEAVVEACIKTLCSQSQMTEQRIVRKVAEQYKLKKIMQAV